MKYYSPLVEHDEGSTLKSEYSNIFLRTLYTAKICCLTVQKTFVLFLSNAVDAGDVRVDIAEADRLPVFADYVFGW